MTDPTWASECGTVKLWLGDCLDVMKSWPDGAVDVVVTDPPYGMKYHSGYYKNGNPYGPIVGDEAWPAEAMACCRESATVCCMAFCRWDNLSQLSGLDSCCAWIKNNWTAGDLNHDYARQWEAVAVWNGPRHQWAGGRPSDVLMYDRVPPTSLRHPTEKPVPLLVALIGHHVGQIVADPFMGSGTTGVAAVRLGRSFWGVEIDPGYFEIAKRRIQEELAKVDFLEPNRVKERQAELFGDCA